MFFGVWFFFLSCGCSSFFSSQKAKDSYIPPSVLSQKVFSRWQPHGVFLPEVSLYIQKIAERFRISEFSSVRVSFFRDQNPCEENCAFVGNRLYFSLKALRSLKYENELAFFLALQLAHLKRGDAWRRAQFMEPADFWGANGVFRFSLEDEKEAVKLAIRWLYDTGYDPRGAISFLDSWKGSLWCRRWRVADWEELKQVAYQAIAAQSPLRNPMIHSEDFLLMQKHLEGYQDG